MTSKRIAYESNIGTSRAAIVRGGFSPRRALCPVTVRFSVLRQWRGLALGCPGYARHSEVRVAVVLVVALRRVPVELASLPSDPGQCQLTGSKPGCGFRGGWSSHRDGRVQASGVWADLAGLMWLSRFITIQGESRARTAWAAPVRTHDPQPHLLRKINSSSAPPCAPPQ